MKPDDLDHASRGHAVLPPSSADKWLHCHAWMRTVAFHRELYGSQEVVSAAAAEGTAAHERFEIMLRQSAQGETEFDEDLLPLVEWVHSQEGAKYYERTVDWGAELGGFVDLTGTVDVTIVADDCITVADLKYGRGLVEVEENPQLMTYLSGLVDLHGRRKFYRLAILQPRAYHKDGPVRIYELDNEELDGFRSRLLIAVKANFGNGQPVAGDHCRKFCPALASCREVIFAARRRLFDARDDV